MRISVVALLIDTASPAVRIGIADGATVVAREEWQADRTLAETIATRIERLLRSHTRSFSDIARIRVHAGPGGFTTLRIGVVTANALGYALGVPVEGVVGPLTSLKELVEHPAAGTTKGPVVPIYDRPPHITPRRNDPTISRTDPPSV